MDKVATVVDLEVDNHKMKSKIRIQIIRKIILVTVKESLEIGGAREVKASKGSKVILYVIIVEEHVICRPLVTRGRMI